MKHVHGDSQEVPLQTPRPQNLTIRLNPETLRKARSLAAERETSVTRLLAGLVEELVGREQTFEAARSAALAYLNQGFPMGGRINASRDEWHER